MHLTVHLFGPGVPDTPQALVSLPGGARLERPTSDPGFDCVAAGVFRAADRPGWAGYVDRHFAFDWQRLVASSVVLLTEVAGRWFAITFGRAHSLLRHDQLVSDFGLRTTANSLPPDGWQSVTTVSLHAPGRRTGQRLARPGGRGDFTVEVEDEWTHTLGGVTGGDLARAMSGSQALRVGVPGDHRLEELPELLEHLLDRYSATAYRERFGFIDHIAPLPKSDHRCADLDILVERRLHIGRGTGLTLLAPPDIDVESGSTCHLRGRKQQLDLDQLVSAASASRSPLELRVEVRDGDGLDAGTRPVREFLSTEASLSDGIPYVLSGGRWFAVARDYVRELRSFLSAVPVLDDLGLPHWYTSYAEETYNRQAAEDLSWLLLDRAPFRGLDRAHDVIEIADLVSPAMDFVCVKRMRGAADLSHLFAQGSVSARLFAGDATYRTHAREQIMRRWPAAGVVSPRIVYAIGVRRRRRLPDELPFFSRVHLRTHVETIRRAGLSVALAAIPLSDIPPNLRATPRPDLDRDGGDQSEMRLF